MKERIKQIRKNSKSTQKSFAESLGLSQNFIAQVESGTKNVSDRTIKDICRTFNVNEEWLRTGKGEMHNLPTDEIAEAVSDLLLESNPLYDMIIDILKIYHASDAKTQEALKGFIKRVSEERGKD